MKFILFLALTVVHVLSGRNLSTCSRDLSQGKFGVQRYELPKSCIFHPENNIYSDQESHKILTERIEWKCSYCNKHFVSEHYLDKHFENKHVDKIKISESSICLADFCDIFGCAMLSRQSAALSFDYAGNNRKLSSFEHIEHCSVEDVRDLTASCHMWMTDCFIEYPPMYNYAIDSICNSVSCEQGILKTPRLLYDQPRTSPIWLIQLILCIFAVSAILMFSLKVGAIPSLSFVPDYSSKKNRSIGSLREKFTFDAVNPGSRASNTNTSSLWKSLWKAKDN